MYDFFANTMQGYALIAFCAYLLGSINSAILVSRITMGKDIRQFGSGNAGLTNSLRVMGVSRTLLVLFGDVAKGAVAVWLGGALCGLTGKMIAGIFVILGHVFPVYFGFRGGKGVLVGAVLLLFIDWRIFAIAISLFVIAVALTRWVSLGSMLGAISFPISMLIFHRQEMPSFYMALGMAAAIVYLHRSNIGRIVRGEENKLSFGKKKAETAGKEEE